MLSEKTKQEVQDFTTILTKLDDTGRAIMLSNATVLLARQEVSKGKNQTNHTVIGSTLERK